MNHLHTECIHLLETTIKRKANTEFAQLPSCSFTFYKKHSVATTSKVHMAAMLVLLMVGNLKVQR